MHVMSIILPEMTGITTFIPKLLLMKFVVNLSFSWIMFLLLYTNNTITTSSFSLLYLSVNSSTALSSLD